MPLTLGIYTKNRVFVPRKASFDYDQSPFQMKGTGIQYINAKYREDVLKNSNFIEALQLNEVAILTDNKENPKVLEICKSYFNDISAISGTDVIGKLQENSKRECCMWDFIPVFETAIGFVYSVHHNAEFGPIISMSIGELQSVVEEIISRGEN